MRIKLAKDGAINDGVNKLARLTRDYQDNYILEEAKFIDLDEIEIDYESAKYIPQEAAIKYDVVPFKMGDNCIKVATSSNNCIEALEYIRFITKMNVVFYNASHIQVKRYIQKIYNIKNVDDLVNQYLYKTRSDLQVNVDKKNNIGIDEAPIIKLLDYLVFNAISVGASDIHFEIFENHMIIRYRIDGMLINMTELPKEIHSALSMRIKIMAGLDISEKRIPQDGKIRYKIKNRDYDLRVSSLPTVYGEKFVIRILYKDINLSTLDLLGFDSSFTKCIRTILAKSNGLFLVTGPTGSGKSTTLYSILNELKNSNRNIVTIEDPVEYVIHGINQVNVNNKAGMSFAKGLRSILRQDPDIIMVGEIRDEETAEIAVRAAITGHLVISTLHTYDAASAITRLINMGVQKYLIADALLAIVSQRLVRTLCENCKTIDNLNTSNKEYLAIDNNKIFKGKGCSKCRGTGYKGRKLVYEFMDIDNKAKELINNGVGSSEVRQHLTSKGVISLEDNCRRLVLDGQTSFEELVKVSQNIKAEI